MNFIDQKYVRMLVVKLDRPKWVRSDVVCMRCPECGDSVKKNKRRGYIFAKGDKTIFHCHNCGASMPFGQFLKKHDPYLYSEYRLERYRSDVPRIAPTTNDAEIDFRTGTKKTTTTGSGLLFSELPSIWSLAPTHPARKIVEQRLIPKDDRIPILYAKNFPRWASSSFKELEKWASVTPHPRFVLPMYDSTGLAIGFCARAFGNETPKYCNVNFYPEREYIYGLDRVDRTVPCYVVEGAIDSIILSQRLNCVAAMSLNIQRGLSVGLEHMIMIPDNQPRHKEVVANIRKIISKNIPVVLFPRYIRGKDINEMVLNGHSIDEVCDAIRENTFVGPRAELEFASWQRI